MIRKTKTIKPSEKSTYFIKKQILKSEQFTSSEKDILSSLLNEKETYTLEGVKEMIKDFLEREAN